ncbi:sphingosine N-acyltransferase [Saccharomycopsis crataegensis]|uniref:Sphingosine N-acyltransferase n=1 Tax=Saccharomycopsis crataegensis TaxID=43959 RepID=A0AAV5QK86_9ASCO|nr:sphingosine N-acyltransferase [Saccharomycopsis crataegensis]
MPDSLKVSENTVGNRRRGSSVGNMATVGQHGLSLSTTISKDSKHKRLRKLNTQKVKNKQDLLAKFYYSFLELNFRMTWLSPLLVVVSVLTCYLLSNNYTESNPLHMFITISYKTDEIDDNGYYLYDKGPKDFAFVFFYMIFFTFFREFVMSVLLKPMAYKLKVHKTGKVGRFTEQMYSIVYYGISSPFGMWVMMKLPVGWFNTYYFYETYPHKTIFSWMKVFYLGQAAFWSQQAVVVMLQLEKPRKDFQELVYHHIITMCLIYASYTFNFTWIGIAIYLTMDISDWFLSLSKVLNYLDAAITPVFFVLFVGSWIYFRHYLNIKILWSVLTEFETVGTYRLDYQNGAYKCFISKPIVFVLLFALHLLNLFWLFFILRILYRYIFQGVAKDDRSDDEDSEDEDDYEGYSTDSEEDSKEKKE